MDTLSQVLIFETLKKSEIKEAGIKGDCRCGKLFSPSPSANAVDASSSRVSQTFSYFKLFLYLRLSKRVKVRILGDFLSGFCCRTCGFKFHQKCALRVPKLCQQVSVNEISLLTQDRNESSSLQVRMQKILAAAMLAGETGMAESMVGIIMPGSSRLDQVGSKRLDRISLN